MKLNKSATFNFMNQWPELFFFIMFGVGLVLSFLSYNKTMTYIIISISGIMSARFLYQKRDKFKLPFYLIIVGYLLGFVLGVLVSRQGDWKIVILLYILFNMASYYIHEKGWISD